MKTSSLYIMSSERSGSNLLRKMLGAHPDICAPNPLHFWVTLSKMLIFYGDLSINNNFTSLVEDAIKITRIKNTHLSWNLKINKEDIYKNLNNKSLAALISAIYQLYCKKENCNLWVCKENNIFDHALNIQLFDPQSKFIYLVRDGRDVACSERRWKYRKRHIYYLAKKWIEEQSKCINIFQNLKVKKNIIIVRYEDLLSDPEKELKRISKFAGFTYDKAMLSFYENKKPANTSKNEGWKNLSKPLMSDNKNKYLNELTKKQIKIFESVASDYLTLFNYNVKNKKTKKINLSLQLLFLIKNRFLIFVYKRKKYMDNSTIILNKEKRKIYMQRAKCAGKII